MKIVKIWIKRNWCYGHSLGNARHRGSTPEDKISYKKQVLNAVANDRGWIKDNNLTKQNGRVVYIDPKDKNVFWSQDTQHGTFEKHDIKGKHLGEFDIEGNMTKPAGNHKLNIK